MPVRQPKLADYLSSHNESWKQNPSGGTHSHCGNFREVVLKAKDINNQNGTSLQKNGRTLNSEEVVIRGNFFRKDVQEGLSIICCQSHEEIPFTIKSHQNSGLSCIFFLNGHVDLKIGQLQIEMSPKLGRSVSAACILKAEKVPFYRTTYCSQDVCHLVVSATPDWLAKKGFYNLLSCDQNRELKENKLISKQWNPSVNLVSVIQDILEPTVLTPEILDLQLESKAIEVVSQCMGVLLQEECLATNDIKLTRHEKIRLQRAREIIVSVKGATLNVEQIAQQVGISASGLQRLFRRAENCSVFDYARTVRLNEARSLLQSGKFSVQEVSGIAGYQSPANFTTAFKRCFGCTPKEVYKPL